MAQPVIGVIGIKGGWSSERLADAVERKTGTRLLFDMADVCADLDSGAVACDGRNLGDCDALIIKKIAPGYAPDNLDRLELLNFVAKTGTLVCSPPDKLMRLLDRLSCTVELRLAGIPMQPTTITEDPVRAVETVRRYGRAVLKPLFTSKARGMDVLDADDPELAKKIIGYREAHRVIYIQQFIPELKRDLGVSFLGGEYIATYSRVKKNRDAWNTTTAQGGKYEPVEPGDEVIALAKKAQDIFNLDFTCVDVAETGDGLRVFEVSAFGGFRGLLEANNYDAADNFVDHVIRRLDRG